MKPAAGILLLVWSLVMFQPAFAFFGGKAAYGSCTEKLAPKTGGSKKDPSTTTCSKKITSPPACSKKKCTSPGQENDNDCGEKRCNPTLGCTLGNFYVHAHHQVVIPSWHSQKEKLIVTNDNRIAKNLSECWHPPEA